MEGVTITVDVAVAAELAALVTVNMKVVLCVNGAVAVKPWLTGPMPLSIAAIPPLNWARSIDFWPEPTFAGAASKNATAGAATSVADLVPARLLSGVVGFWFASTALSVSMPAELEVRNSNRLWQFAPAVSHSTRGLVHPVDQMHSENPPTIPGVPEWLGDDLAEHGYDLRRLVRGLVLSRAYARSSRWEHGPPPRPELFAVARVRPLTPLQLATALRLATAAPEALPAATAELEKRLEALEASARGFAPACGACGWV